MGKIPQLHVRRLANVLASPRHFPQRLHLPPPPDRRPDRAFPPHHRADPTPQGTSGLSPRHLSSLRLQASTSSPCAPATFLYSRGRCVQTRPAMCPVASSYQAQAQPAQDNQSAGNPRAPTLLTAAAYHIVCHAILAGRPQPARRYRFSSSTWPCLPLCHAHARCHCWAQALRRCQVLHSCAASGALLATSRLSTVHGLANSPIAPAVVTRRLFAIKRLYLTQSTPKETPKEEWASDEPLYVYDKTLNCGT